MPVIDATATRSTPPPMFVTITDRGAHAIPAGFMHGHNPRTGTNEQQIVLAANITNLSTNFSQLARRSTRPRKRAEINQPPKAIAADAGYRNQQQLDKDAADPSTSPSAPTSAYASARTSTTSAASAATGFVNGHPSPAGDGTIAFVLRPVLGVLSRWRGVERRPGA